MENISLYTRINSLPSNLQKEVRDFVEFLKHKLEKDKAENFNRSRVFGQLRGKIEIAPDFDEPLNDFKDYL
ncbi:MAG: DUF2281 domain-containing protein [Bacteroidota bacterium]